MLMSWELSQAWGIIWIIIVLKWCPIFFSILHVFDVPLRQHDLTQTCVHWRFHSKKFLSHSMPG